jgi:hypothetical protein
MTPPDYREQAEALCFGNGPGCKRVAERIRAGARVSGGEVER